jgi:hypothetical protein
MSVYVECICGKKYHVDRAQVQKFDCEGCGRALVVPSPQLEAKLNQLRERMKQGEPGMRDAMSQAVELKNSHAMPLIREGAQSGLREAVNIALVGMADFPGDGRQVLTDWIVEGRLSVNRLISAMREGKYAMGADYLCDLVAKGKLKESHITEIAPYLGDSGSQRALETLKALRRKHPNLGGILDDALAKLRHLDDSAGGIPDEAKMIPGRPSGRQSERQPAKKGCVGLLLAGGAFVGMLVGALLLGGNW